MLRLREKFEAWMSAIAFAEANEHETALEFVGRPSERKKRFSFGNMMTAITFAEAGEHNMAREYLGVTPEPEIAKTLDIPGVKIWYGSVALEPVPIEGVRIWIGTVMA
jgi:hypothetical protein